MDRYDIARKMRRRPLGCSSLESELLSFYEFGPSSKWNMATRIVRICTTKKYSKVVVPGGNTSPYFSVRVEPLGLFGGRLTTPKRLAGSETEGDAARWEGAK
mmetsp:Transcript_11196/g.20293  ORF Transcript_11196/g.20293 Transcript_11196/m.20293 type:complete len:102 (-) Transcript_11196:520-825(-)